MTTQRAFLEIFRDAVVIDVDFTDWNNKIVLGVIAASATMVRGRKQRTFLVEFHKPTKFECAFNHYATMRKFRDPFVWRIDKFQLIRKDNSWQASFKYLPDFPEMNIACKALKIRELKTTLIRKHFPEWSGRGGDLCAITLAKAVSKRSGKKQ